jgi:hypothetical protein
VLKGKGAIEPKPVETKLDQVAEGERDYLFIYIFIYYLFIYLFYFFLLQNLVFNSSL